MCKISFYWFFFFWCVSFWWLREETKFIFGMNCTSQLSNVNILRFQEDCQPDEQRKIYHSACKRSAKIISFRMNTHRVGKQFKKCCLNKTSFQLLLISFLFYSCNSLENRAENRGVLLNWQVNVRIKLSFS